jgi:MEDS: MEthanogen/methylotroph, DcmR Sensory domain
LRHAVPELTQEILNLRPGHHLCVFYDKDPSEQMPALVPFIQDALSSDEQFVYIADDQTVEELEGRLKQSGINVGKECDRGALKLWTRREWRQPGKLSSEAKSRQVLQYVHEATQSGFNGSRFAVEMTWALGPDIRRGLARTLGSHDQHYFCTRLFGTNGLPIQPQPSCI